MSALVSLLLTNAVAAGVLALLAWGVSRFSRRQALVHGLWLLAIAKLVTPPVLPLRVLPSWNSLWPAPSVVVVPIPPPARREPRRAAAADLEPASVPVAVVHRPAAATPRQAPPIVPEPEATVTSPAAGAPSPGQPLVSVDLPRATAWLLAIGALAILGLTATRFLRFQRLLAGGEPAGPSIARRTEDLGRRLGLRRTPAVWLVAEALPPLLWPSAAGPRLVLPTGLLSRLTEQELDALLAHELAHVRRGDHWVRLVEVAATALFWWYPVAWWSRRALRRAEERCCDEWVLRVLPSSAQAYASGLLKSLTFVSGAAAPLPVGASGAGPVHDLEARLKEILMTRPLPQLGRPFRFALAAAAALGLAVFPTSALPRSVTADAAAPAAPATAAAPAPPAPAIAATPRAVRAPFAVRALVGPGVVAAVPGGVVGGVPGGVVGGVTGGVRALIVGTGPVALLDDTGDPALAAERRALEDQRHQLHQQELDIERKSLELEARAEQAQLKAEADRLRADGRAAELALVEKQGELNAQRFELRKHQLQLRLEHANLEAELERTERADEERVAALEKSGQDAQAEQLRRELERTQEGREHAAQGLEQKEQALEAEMEKLEQEQRAFETQHRVQELRRSSDELRQDLAERIDSLREALPEAGAQKAELEAEIRKLQAALDALGGRAGASPSPAPKPSPGETPRPSPRTAPRPQP